jgi:hypothetical protein
MYKRPLLNVSLYQDPEMHLIKGALVFFEHIDLMLTAEISIAHIKEAAGSPYEDNSQFIDNVYVQLADFIKKDMVKFVVPEFGYSEIPYDQDPAVAKAYREEAILAAIDYQRKYDGDLWAFIASLGLEPSELTKKQVLCLRHVFELSRVAHPEQWIPFADDEDMYYFLSRGIDSLINDMSNATIREFKEELGIRETLLAFETLRDTLPCLPIEANEDVFFWRQELKEEIAGFRGKMSELACQVELYSHETGFVRHVRNFVTTEVTPSISALRDRAKVSAPRVTRDGIARASLVGVLNFALHSFLGVPVGIVAAIASAAIPIAVALPYVLERRELAKNGYALFLKYPVSN